MHSLMELLQHPFSKLASHISELSILATVGEGLVPWFHLLPRLLAKLPYCQDYAISLQASVAALPSKTSPSVSGTRPFRLRSVHWNLPAGRIIPSHSAGLRWLTLHNMHFASFIDLVHLLSELPDLQCAKLKRLTWPEGPPVDRLRSHWRWQQPQLGAVCVEGCPADERTIWLLSNYRAGPGTELILIDEHFSVTSTSLFQWLQTSIDIAGPVYLSMDRQLCLKSKYTHLAVGSSLLIVVDLDRITVGERRLR